MGLWWSSPVYYGPLYGGYPYYHPGVILLNKYPKDQIERMTPIERTKQILPVMSSNAIKNYEIAMKRSNTKESKLALNLIETEYKRRQQNTSLTSDQLRERRV